MILLFREPWFLFIAVLALLSGSAAVGYRLSSATRVNDVSHLHEQISSLRDGLFVLLGLLLGFTIAMVLPRFDHRQDLVIQEASAIRTTLMRAETLPEPERSKTLELLREYIAVRNNFANVGLGTPLLLARNTEQTRTLQDQIWQQAVAVSQQSQTSVLSAFMISLNDAIDASDQRLLREIAIVG